MGRGGLSRVATRVCGRAVLTSEGGAALQRARRPPAARPHPSPPLPTLCFFIFSVQGGITFQTRACPSTLPLSSRAVPIHRPAGGGAPAPAGAAAALPHPRVKSRAHRSWRPRHPAHALQGPSVIHVRLPLPLPRLESCNQPPSDPPIAFIAPPLPPPPPHHHIHTPPPPPHPTPPPPPPPPPPNAGHLAALCAHPRHQLQRVRRDHSLQQFRDRHVSALGEFRSGNAH